MPIAVTQAATGMEKYIFHFESQTEVVMQQSISRFKYRIAALLVLVAMLASMISINNAKAQTAQAVFRVDGNGNITKNGVAIRIKGG